MIAVNLLPVSCRPTANFNFKFSYFKQMHNGCVLGRVVISQLCMVKNVNKLQGAQNCLARVLLYQLPAQFRI